MKKTVIFVDKRNIRFNVDSTFGVIENQLPCFAFNGISGVVNGLYDCPIVPANEAQKTLKSLWSEYHLKIPKEDDKELIEDVFEKVAKCFASIEEFEKQRIEHERLILFDSHFEDFKIDCATRINEMVEKGNNQCSIKFLTPAECSSIVTIMSAFDVSFVDAVAGFRDMASDVDSLLEIGFKSYWYGLIISITN